MSAQSSTAAQQLTAQIGGIPSTIPDIPILAVFIAIFVSLAAGHMTLLQMNNRKKHKFLFNGMLFGFAMSRIMACVFRLVWAKQPTNADISLVASVFLNAGILLVYIINNLLAWRMVRSSHPAFGWDKRVRIINKAMLWLVLPMIVPLIVIIILRVKSPSTPGVTDASTVMARLAQTYFLIIAVQSAFLLAYAAYRGESQEVIHQFGHGSWNAKLAILTITTALAIIEAGFRCGTAWTPTPLASDPAWWDHKAAFYCFNFLMDVLILGTFLVARIDRRFWVPNKADGNYEVKENSGSDSSEVKEQA